MEFVLRNGFEWLEFEHAGVVHESTDPKAFFVLPTTAKHRLPSIRRVLSRRLATCPSSFLVWISFRSVHDGEDVGGGAPPGFADNPGLVVTALVTNRSFRTNTESSSAKKPIMPPEWRMLVFTSANISAFADGPTRTFLVASYLVEKRGV